MRNLLAREPQRSNTPCTSLLRCRPSLSFDENDASLLLVLRRCDGDGVAIPDAGVDVEGACRPCPALERPFRTGRPVHAAVASRTRMLAGVVVAGGGGYTGNGTGLTLADPFLNAAPTAPAASSVRQRAAQSAWVRAAGRIPAFASEPDGFARWCSCCGVGGDRD
jgi:hypothetical protein